MFFLNFAFEKNGNLVSIFLIKVSKITSFTLLFILITNRMVRINQFHHFNVDKRCKSVEKQLSIYCFFWFISFRTVLVDKLVGHKPGLYLLTASF